MEILLLPIIAVLLCIAFPVLPRVRQKAAQLYPARKSAKVQSSDTPPYTEHFIWFLRWVAASLLVAPLIVNLFGVDDVNRLLQGVIVTFALLVPYLFLLAGVLLFKTVSAFFMRAFRRKRGKKRSRRLVMPASSIPIAPAIREYSQPEPVVAHAQPVVAQTTSAAPHQTEVQRQVPPKTQAKPDSVEEHLQRVSESVTSYDLSDLKTDIDSPLQVRKSAQESENAATDKSLQLSGNAVSIDKPKVERLQSLVTTLQTERGKLQKLVIAQQAAFDSERTSHERTRNVAREAIKVMRTAKENQRTAEKIARREMSKRKALETEYQKLAKTLANAKSVLKPTGTN